VSTQAKSSAACIEYMESSRLVWGHRKGIAERRLHYRYQGVILNTTPQPSGGKHLVLPPPLATP